MKPTNSTPVRVPARAPWRVAIPCALTLASHALALVAASLIPAADPRIVAALLWLSLALDLADGATARALRGVSQFGARLDHAGDAIVSCAIWLSLARAGAVPPYVALCGGYLGAVLFAASHGSGRPVSGRAALSIAAPLALALTRRQ